jgi:hypothetical protein
MIVPARRAPLDMRTVVQVVGAGVVIAAAVWQVVSAAARVESAIVALQSSTVELTSIITGLQAKVDGIVATETTKEAARTDQNTDILRRLDAIEQHLRISSVKP